MLALIENNGYTMLVDTKGAEIRSLKNREGQEMFWQRTLDEAGEKIWGNTAINLFPLTGPAEILDETGKVKETGAYTLYGKIYKLGQHGFIRNTEAEFVKPDENKPRMIGGSEIKLKISSSDETKEVYPFDFDYVVHYKLSDKGLVAKTITVTNKSDKDMPFNIGDHEGYALDDDINKYYLRFDCIEEINTERNGRPLIETVDDRSIIRLNREMFMLPKQDGKYDKHGNRKEKGGYGEKAVQIPGIKSKYVTLVKCGENGEKDKGVVTLKLDAPNFLLWSKPPFKFVCPEPWHGEVSRFKEGEEAKFYNNLKPGETYTLSRIIYAHSTSKKELKPEI